MKKPKRFEVTKAKPYNLGELYSNSYNVQNMLIDQFNFPLYFYQDDFISSQYIDRIPNNKYDKAYKKHLSGKVGFSNWDNPISDKKRVLRFFNDLFGELDEKLTGYRVVRFTNVSSGYPCHRFDLFAKSPKTPVEETYSGQDGKNVESYNFNLLNDKFDFPNWDW